MDAENGEMELCDCCRVHAVLIAFAVGNANIWLVLTMTLYHARSLRDDCYCFSY